MAERAGLEVGRGIKVNPFMQTSDADIYALGDVAELPGGKVYAFILPIRSQAHWLAGFISGQDAAGWTPPVFTTRAKVHGFEAVYPYVGLPILKVEPFGTLRRALSNHARLK